MLSPSKMITSFSGVDPEIFRGGGCQYTFQFHPPNPKNIHQNISDEERAFKECSSIFFVYTLFFSYVYFWIFIYFLREEENDFLQIRGLWKLVNWLQMSPKPVHNLVPVFLINSEAFLNGLTGDPLHVTV